MKLSDFDYELDPSFIAKYPAPGRVLSKLLVYDRKTEAISHRRFSDIVDYFGSGDLIILNNTKVIPARIYAEKSTGGKIELLLTEKIEENRWQVLIKGKVRKGTNLILKDGLRGVVQSSEEKIKTVRFSGDIDKYLDRYGHIPLPPYIKRADLPEDRKNYQTVYAKKPGAIAAPTAGLHFTDELIERLKKKGVKFGELTLHVGIGTFSPVEVEDIKLHKMHYEKFSIGEELAELYNSTKGKGKIVAVGTTVIRALESSLNGNRLEAKSGSTNLFIYPGKKIRTADALITNFHLPKSTLLMLVQAFIGKNLQPIYNEAIRLKYRFYSYGDAMLIL